MVKKQLHKLAHPTLAKKVESKILMQINTIVPDAELISRDLGMASRTLQRHLKEEGTSFKDILKEVRKTQAIDRVLTNSESIESIASSLGYSDQRAFSKAFKNWVGHSPTSYRSRFKRS
jgi:AraC-like DNA-binding protein